MRLKRLETSRREDVSWKRCRWSVRVLGLIVILVWTASIPAPANLTVIEAGRFSVRGEDCLSLQIQTNGGWGNEVKITVGTNAIIFETDSQGRVETGYLKVPAGTTGVKVELVKLLDTTGEPCFPCCTNPCKIDDQWPWCCTIPLAEIPAGRYERVPSCMDTASPLTAFRVDPLPTSYGWNNSPVTVTLQAEDDKSGPAQVCYALSGVTTQEARCTFGASTAFDLENEGITTVSYHAIDGWENRETAKEDEAKIDLTPPSISGSRSPQANEHGWNNENVRVTFHCSDSLSGIASRPSDRTLSSEGKDQSVTDHATDKAGNTSYSTVEGISIDKTRPEIRTSTRQGTMGKNGWFISNVTVPFTATDNLAGFASDGRLTTDGRQSTSEEGRSVYARVSVRDWADNVAETTVGPFAIDRTPPAINLSGSSGTGKATGSWEISDSVSGVDPQSCLVTISGPGITGVGGRTRLSTDCSGHTTLTYDRYGAGEFTVHVSSADKAGNESEESIPVTISPPYGAIKGQVVDATTDDPIAGASVSLSPTDCSTTTDSDGCFIFSDLLADTYTVSAQADGFTTSTRTVSCEAGETAELVLALSPAGEWRIVLTWGADPEDLDSHLWTPDGEHIWYGLQEGSPDRGHNADLDVDHTDGFGPETVTITHLVDGTYVYAVKNYTGEGNLAHSEAQVEVFSPTGESAVRTFSQPPCGTGERWWIVFKLHVHGGSVEIKSINRCLESFEEDSSSPPDL